MHELPLTQWGPDGGGNCEYHWKGAFLQAHFLSDVGKRRPHNEDSCLLCAPEDDELADRKGALFAVADGMGGASAGEHASKLALHTFAERYYADARENIPESLAAALSDANAKVYEEAQDNPMYHGMGTTFSSVVIHGNYGYVTQVGDSRVYLVRDGHALLQLTDDHSLVAEQVRGGYISEEDARNHALKNLITRAVGIKETVKVDQFVVRLKVGDTILICSDGLSNMLRESEIAEALALDLLQGAAHVLVGRALEQGGPDNITVGLIRVVAAPPKVRAHEGASEIALPGKGLWARIARLFS